MELTKLPVEAAEAIHRILREELPDVPDPDLHRAGQKMVRVVRLFWEVVGLAVAGVPPTDVDSELKSLVQMYFPTEGE